MYAFQLSLVFHSVTYSVDEHGSLLVSLAFSHIRLHDPCPALASCCLSHSVRALLLIARAQQGLAPKYLCSPGFILTHSTLVSKLFLLAVQGSGAILSSNLEGALYKST